MSVDFIAVTSLFSQSSTAPWQWKSTVSGTYSSPSLEYMPMAVLVGIGGPDGSAGSGSVVNSSLAMLSKQSGRQREREGAHKHTQRQGRGSEKEKENKSET